MTSKSGNRYSPELRERAVRMLLEQRDNYASDNAAVKSIAPKIGCSPDTLRAWFRQHERDNNGGDGGLSTSERQRLKELERENRELRRSNDILRQASAYFAKAEFVYGRLLFCQVIVAILVPTVKIAVV
ncbi:transposase, partial [Salmonella enterica]|uniref:transposase n=1 Tax=Salmonella enterica TaxID=28901 RepID=UPI003D312656